MDVTDLVPGDVVDLRLGDIVPADVRLLAVSGLECDESVLTGESLPVDKYTDPTPAGTALAELSGCALMGTVVHAGSGRGVVVATGARTEFGKIAAGLSTHQLDTEFQVGLRKFSMLLVYVAGRADHRRSSSSTWCCTNRSWTRCCSHWPSRSASHRSCCPPSCPPAWPPDHAG